MKETVDLIVVNYNTKKLLAACLASLRRFSGAPETYRLWVVDNASTDGSATFIRSLPWVTGLLTVKTGDTPPHVTRGSKPETLRTSLF